MNDPLRLTVLGTGYLGTTHAACELVNGDLANVPVCVLGADRNIVDGRNVLDPALWRAAGWNFRSLGAAPAASLSTRFGGRRSAKDRGEVGSV
jgi:hypothetical protein